MKLADEKLVGSGQFKMGAFATLKGFFVRSEPMHAPFNDPFVQIDRKQIALDLDLQSKGREQGELELPRTTALTLDTAESEVVAKFQELLNSAQITVANQMRVYDTRLSELGLLDRLTSVQSASLTAISDFDVDISKLRNGLTNDRQRIFESFAELRQFQSDNGLRRPPHPPRDRRMAWALIAVAWLLESGLNSFFLQAGNDLGLLGGLTSAGGIAFVNVGVSVAVGWFAWPWLRHVSVSGKTLGAAIILIWVLAVVAWNLLAAHYRDASDAGSPDAASVALSSLTSAPFAVDNLYSLGLLITGILFALLSAHAAFSMDDPYPGYGAVARRHDERCDKYVVGVAAVQDVMVERRNDAISEAESIRSQLGVQFRSRAAALTARQSFAKRFGEYQDALEGSARSLLALYRSSNIGARTTPAPTYFDEPWNLRRTELEISDAQPWLKSELENADQSLKEAIERITAAFDKASGSIETLDKLRERFADARS